MKQLPNPSSPIMLWACPHCGSPDLMVFFSERRIAVIDQTMQGEVTPYYADSDLVGADSDDQSVLCLCCHAIGITPVQQRGDGKENMAQYPLRLRSSLLAQVRRMARGQDRSMNAVLTEALVTYLSHARGAADQAQEQEERGNDGQ